VRAASVLGAPIHLLTDRELLDQLLTSPQGSTIGHHNLHSLFLLTRVPALSDFYRMSSVVFVDGLPVIWLLRAKGVSAGVQHRHTALDWLPGLLTEAAASHRHVVHLGGRERVSERAAARLRAQFAGLRLSVLHGYFDASWRSWDNCHIVSQLNDLRADVLLVGMGMPRQELWVLRHRAQLNARVVVTIGGTFDYLGGAQRTPPRWLGPLGLEGVYRLGSHPLRLWRRYLVEPVCLIAPLTRDVATSRHRRRPRPKG
jgi:N-acetylglucosaminyldiphosphoundecaprenol N-acetyl-beta-D-mannosaminyltransferase